MVWVGSELTDPLVPYPLPWAGTPCLDQAAQSLIQPGFEHFQAWAIYNFPEQPVPVPHDPHSKKNSSIHLT